MKKWFLNTINSGHERSVKAKKNIIASFFIKGIGLLVSFVTVPIILNYLDIEKYGVWLTIASIVTWVNYFDLGIGHGLRNKFAIALASDDKEKGARLVSTSYYYISLIFATMSIITIPLLLLLDWQKVLNVNTIANNELLYSVLIVFVMFVLRFILNLITMILKADQRPALASVFLPIGSIISLIIISLLGLFTSDSLFLACLAISAPPVLTVLIANILLFSNRYRQYRPRLVMIDKKLLNEVLFLGFKFFIIQIAGLVMFSSSNLIITQLINPAEVAIFNIARQYYGLPFMFFGIILTPFWSAITDAYTKNELEWIRQTMRKLLRFSFIFSLFLLIMLIFSDFAFRAWLGNQVTIPLDISISMTVLNIFYIFFAPYSSFINGVGKLNLGLRVVMVKTVMFLPVAIIMTNQFGATGLVISLILVNSIPSAIFETLQYKKIIDKKAHGVWNR